MGRLALLPEQQHQILARIESKLSLDAEDLAKACQVHPRTFRDWKRGKYRISDAALRLLCERSGIPFPRVEVLPEFWSAKKAGHLGAITSYQIYGNPGTPEGRLKGGLKAGRILRKRFRDHPELLKKLGFVVAKEIKRPALSPLLAEFVGILIGDGGIRNGLQVTISFHSSKEIGYARWIQRTAMRLFGLGSSLSLRKDSLGGDVVISSVNLVRWLDGIAGLKPGNKLRNGLDVPAWIWQRWSFQIACLRGLMDTDGGPFLHRYQVNGKWYTYPKLCFYSKSEALRKSVCRLFEEGGFHPRLARSDRIFIDRREEASFLSRRQIPPQTALCLDR